MPYLPYLLPGAAAFIVVIGYPLVTNVYFSLFKWRGGMAPLRWNGLGNYADLLGDDKFWTSFGNSLAMIVAMVLVPTLLGLVLAAVLFDYLGRRFGERVSSVLRATYYLPQILPVAVAGVLWNWILNSQTGALNAILRGIGIELAAQLARRPHHRAAVRDARADLGPDGLPRRHLHGGAAACGPGALRGGRARRRRLVGPVPGHHRAPDPARDVRGHADLHGRGAQGVRARSTC